MPYETPNGCIYDSGDYARCLDIALELIDYDGARARQEESRTARSSASGSARRSTPGTNNFGQSTLLNPELQFSGNNEVATIKLDIFGEIVLTLGTVPQGQGHETVASQVAADILGVSPDQIHVRPGHDSYWNSHAGFSGTYASQFAVTGLEAVKGAAEKLSLEIRRLAGGVLGGVDPDDIVLEGGFAKIEGNPEAALPFMACGAIINANNAVHPAGAARHHAELPPRLRPAVRDARLRAKFGNLTLTYATQIHACVVEIDPETGEVEIADYAAVDDCGIRIHPQIVEGQVHGATAHAIGAALYETFAYDEYGQLLTANFYDYHVPHALDLPEIKTGHIESPSPFSSLGTKGMGEGGGAAIHAICAAIQDALRNAGTKAVVNDSFNPPERVWRMLTRPGRDRGTRGGHTSESRRDKGVRRPGAARLGRAERPVEDGEAAPRGRELRDPVDDRRWNAAVKIPLGMGGLKLNFQFEKLEERPIEYAKLSSKGQGVGAIVAMETEFNLKPEGERTHMDWTADVRVAGPIGSMGQRVFQPIVNQQVGNVLDALEAQVEEAKTA